MTQPQVGRLSSSVILLLSKAAVCGWIFQGRKNCGNGFVRHYDIPPCEAGSSYSVCTHTQIGAYASIAICAYSSLT